MRWAIVAAIVAGIAVMPVRGADNDESRDDTGAAAPTVFEIIGAYGFDLGAEFDPAEAIGTETGANGERLFVVEARIPVVPLVNFQLLATPTTRRIAALYGRTKPLSGMDCNLLKESFVRVLSEYYGTPRAGNPNGEIGFYSGQRGIGVNCGGSPPGAKLTVRYFDRTLLDAYEAEASQARKDRT